MPTKALSHSERQRDRRLRDMIYDRSQRGVAFKIRSSSRWQKFRQWFKARHPLCIDPFYFHARDGVLVPMQAIHHIRPVEANPELALSENNCAAICTACHNRIEAMERAGKSTESMFVRGKVTIVCGPPGSGKSTYVRERKAASDIVIDVDALMCALTGLPSHQRTDTALPFVLAAKEELFRLIERDGARGCNVWVTTLLPEANEREALKRRLNADVVVLDVPAEQCMRQIWNDPTRTTRAHEWSGLVDDWWTTYKNMKE